MVPRSVIAADAVPLNAKPPANCTFCAVSVQPLLFAIFPSTIVLGRTQKTTRNDTNKQTACETTQNDEIPEDEEEEVCVCVVGIERTAVHY